MPFTSLLQPPPVRWPIEWIWPVTRRDASGETWQTRPWAPLSPPPLTTTSGNDFGLSVRSAGTSSTGAEISQGFRDGVACYDYWNSEGGTQTTILTAAAYAPTLLQPTGAPGWRGPEATRFGWWRLSQWFGSVGSLWSPSGPGSMGIGLAATQFAGSVFLNSSTPQNPTAGQNRVLCSISCTPSGGSQGLRYDAWDQDAVPIETVAIPGSFERWHTLDFFIRQASGGGPGRLRIHIDGAEIVEREWGSAELEDPTGRADSTPGLAPCFWAGQVPLADQPGRARAITQTHFRAGAFNELGVPLRS